MREVTFDGKPIQVIDDQIVLFDLRQFFSNPTPYSYLRPLQERNEAKRVRANKRDLWVITKEGLRFVLGKLDNEGKSTLREIIRAVYGDDSFLDNATLVMGSGTGATINGAGSLLDTVRNIRQTNLELTLKVDELQLENQQLRNQLLEFEELARELRDLA